LIAFGLFSPIFGTLSDRLNTQAVVLVGGIIYGAGMLLTAQTRNLWQLYLFFGLMLGVGRSAFLVPLTAMMMKWAGDRKGLAVGFISSGTGVGTFVLPPLTRYLISTSGWQGAFAFLGVVALAVILPTALLLRDTPGGKDLQSPGSHPGKARAGENGRWKFLHGAPFWHLFFINFLCCSSHSIPLLHVMPYATDLGVSKMVAASILSLSGATSIVGRIGIGAISDRMGVKRILVAALALQGVMIFWLLGAQATWTFYVFAVFFGIAYGGVMPLYAVLAREYHGEEVMGSVYGGILLGATLGMALGGSWGA
jgi:MFS family permease